jgi:hypothetical protein
MQAQLVGRLLLVSCLVSLGARAEQEGNPRTDYTAYTRPGGRAAVGPFKLELGLIDEVTLGTYVPPWFAYPAIGVVIPNGYVKIGSSRRNRFALAGRAGVTFIDGKGIAELAHKDASASASAFASEVDASLRATPGLFLSLGIDYNHIHAVGNADELASSIEGASTADTWSTRLLTEWHLSRSFSLSLLLRYLIYQSPLNADVDTGNEIVTVKTNLSGEGVRRQRVSVVPGVAFEGENWELQAGIGYGVAYVPILGLPTTYAWPIVDLGFAVSFDLY